MRIRLYTVLVDEKIIQKSLFKYPLEVRERIKEAISDLAYYPPDNTKAIKGHKNMYRKKAGDMRILYILHQKEKAIVVFKIAHRKEVYKGL